MTVKFDIMDEKDTIKKVEITEEYVLGKDPPIIHYRDKCNNYRHWGALPKDDEDDDDDDSIDEEILKVQEKSEKPRYQFTEFEEDLYQQLEEVL